MEYFIPFSLLFTASVFNTINLKFYLKKLKQFFTSKQALGAILLFCFVIYLPILFQANFRGMKSALNENYRFGQFAGVSNWFKNNTLEGEIIFHDHWDDWPVLFYYNSRNKYIIGLDPSFMYFKDRYRYWLWQRITTGEIQNNICQTVKNNFAASYIFVKLDNERFHNNLQIDKECKLVYKDQDGWIYKILHTEF